MRSKVLAVVFTVLLQATGAWAQTTPTGSITGQVVDAQGAVLPGVSVSVTSSALQGARTPPNTSECEPARGVERK